MDMHTVVELRPGAFDCQVRSEPLDLLWMVDVFVSPLEAYVSILSIWHVKCVVVVQNGQILWDWKARCILFHIIAIYWQRIRVLGVAASFSGKLPSHNHRRPGSFGRPVLSVQHRYAENILKRA